MRNEEIAAVRGELEDYVAEVFASLPRKDQRAKGSLYLRGLMLDGRWKSMQPMAERLGVDHQQLQQFVASSTWAVEPVRRRLANLAVVTVKPEAWVIDDTGFKKDGPSSPCVARQYSGTLGKIGNCQIGVSVHAATDEASCPLDWRLYVPEAGTISARKRTRPPLRYGPGGSGQGSRTRSGTAQNGPRHWK